MHNAQSNKRPRAAGKRRRISRLVLQPPDATPLPDRFGSLRLRDFPEPPSEQPTTRASTEPRAEPSSEQVDEEKPEAESAVGAVQEPAAEPVRGLRPRFVIVACIGAAAVGAGAAALDANYDVSLTSGPRVAHASEPETRRVSAAVPADDAVREVVLPVSHAAPSFSPIVTVAPQFTGHSPFDQHAPEARTIESIRGVHTSAVAHPATKHSPKGARIEQKRSTTRDTRRPKPQRGTRPTHDRKRKSAVIAKQTGFLTVAATPYATVYVDGRKMGDTPLIRIELSAGTHRLRGVAADGRSASATVTVRAGDIVRHRLRYGSSP